MPGRADDGFQPFRFTPTRVGNATQTVIGGFGLSVHPHAGGECAVPRIDEQNPHGSPPRGWGMPRCACSCRTRDRFTPTRVGNATVSGGAFTLSQVHPHAGGECRASNVCSSLPSGSPPRGWGMLAEAIAQRWPGGSPPRGWGMRSVTMVVQICSRFTPTRVGNARGPKKNPSRPQVHPHAGGECQRSEPDRGRV